MRVLHLSDVHLRAGDAARGSLRRMLADSGRWMGSSTSWRAARHTGRAALGASATVVELAGRARPRTS